MPRCRCFIVALSFLMLAGCAQRRAPVIEPRSLDSAELSRARQAYLRSCNGCHPGGEGGPGADLIEKPRPGFLIEAQVRVGGGAMPAFPTELLPENQLDQIVAYLERLGKK